MQTIQDIDRPNIREILPKMQSICNDCKQKLRNITPILGITTNDNLMSSVTIRGTFDHSSNWYNNIFHNGMYFILHITPEKGKRYYSEGEKVTLEEIGTSHKLKSSKVRKYTATPEKVIAKIKSWIENNKRKEQINE